ncbi:MAG TPA: phenylalanine--tRNA ligase subunit beta [Pyrinomonadaceae bacterium]|jgi:phenylalanyl-tRNA synthetase beta chain|nr:phenylalanine--tRNA ligase subunit beta [Pyrinomonadaceae bacterium]
MLISYNWLRELTSTTRTARELRDRLTMVGLAVDAVDQHQDDAVLDVEVPSNRPDCLSHIGIAREVTVIDSRSLNLPKRTNPPSEGSAASLTSVEINDIELCPRYAARLIRGVQIGPSPDWLVERLETIGQRSINNVADITNYVLHETGQPLHAFDFAKLSERRIVVRRAVANETLKTLDGVERQLTNEMLVIADAEKPVALAGIMGGEDSEISERTTEVLIESAYFNPDSVRRTARSLVMDTEASRRFERGADCDGVVRAQQRCVELICELAGGVATTDAIDVYPNPISQRIVQLRPERVEALTSISAETSEVKRILTGLGFQTVDAPAGEMGFKVPTWRIDVEQEEDLVEEVARHVGYDKIASELPPSASSGEYQPNEMKLRSLRRTLTGLGLDEAINFSFTEEYEEFESIASAHGPVLKQPKLKNPIIEDAAWMRSTLLPGLLASVRRNMNQGQRDVRLFEVGRVFFELGDGELPEETVALSIVMTGGAKEEGRAVAERDLDFFDLKGILDAAVDSMNLEPLLYSKTEVKHLRSGQAASLSLVDGLRIGSAGRLADSVAAHYKFRQPIFVVELDLAGLLTGPERMVHYTPLPRYPSVQRDISLLIDRGVQFNDLLRAIREEEIRECRQALLVGTFQGANIPADKRSITLRLEYRSDERTLTDEEVEEHHAKLASSLLEKFSAEQR